MISDHRLRGYVFTAKHEFLANKPKPFSLLKGKVGMRIYDWAFIKTVSGVLEDYMERRELSDKIDFIFDQCSELGACIESNQQEKPKWPPSMQYIAGTIGPGNDEELAGLQAADLLAGEHSDYLRSGVRSATYDELAKVPILESAASPPLQLDMLLQYAQEVHERAELIFEMVKQLKQQGVDIDDYRDK